MTRCLLFLLLLLAACRKYYSADVPDTRWDAFEAADAQWLQRPVLERLQGVWTIGSGNDRFGADAVAKWSYVVTGNDTAYYLSLFCQKDITWFLLQGKRRDSVILLNGYWRRMEGTETGPARLTIGADVGGRLLLGGAPLAAGDALINGEWGENGHPPDRPIQLRYARPLPARSTEIVVHRGGGQTADLLPASENSTDIITYAARFGATGIEIDVRFTSDGVPILYHDATLNERLIVKNGMVGPIENYSYAQLNALVRLVRNNERIPTLREALETAVTRTPIRFIWLDTKFTGPLDQVRALQQEFQQRAIVLGKPLEIVIGIPDRDVLNRFQALPGFRTVPSVVELDPEDAEAVNARIWAPRWTLGLQNDKAAAVQAQGRRAFVWTLDEQQNIDLFLTQGRFDGILTDHPTAVAYSVYARP